MTDNQLRSLIFAIFKAGDWIATAVARTQDDTADHASERYLMDLADDAIRRSWRPEE